MSGDNFWAGTGNAGNVNVYKSNDTQLTSIPVGSCPAAVTFDCKKHRMWASSSCGSGNDPVWVFDTTSLSEIGSAITPGGTILQPPVVSSDNDKLYVTSGGVSREINPTTFAVTTTTFGTVLAIDSNTANIFATSGNNLQVIAAKTDAVRHTATLTYTPNAMGVNNAMLHVYLLNSAAGKIDVYTESGNKITTFTLPSGDQPSSIAVDSIRGRLFVDVFNTGTNSWSLLVMEDQSTVRKCGFAGSCDY
jgi:DNA-binding beta-propeller fold protein YncE